MEGVTSLVQIRLAVAVRPPQTHGAVVQLSKVGRKEGYLFLKFDAANPSAQRARNLVVLVVAQQHRGGERYGGIGQRQGGRNQRVGQRHRAFCRQRHIVPDAYVATTHGGNPVPTDGMEGGVIISQDTAVKVGVLCVLFFYRARVCVLHNLYGQGVFA